MLPLIIHGDAAFAGQGILAESLNMATLHGYNVGGTIHVIVNNLLGFTAIPEESNSSRFSSDIAKRLPIPIFHVNAEDPDAVVRVAAIAAEYRHRFHSDVVVDLIGYRRHGHSEVDDPTVTQPRRYAVIKDHPPLYQIYAEQHRRRSGEPRRSRFSRSSSTTRRPRPRPTRCRSCAQLPDYWNPYKGGELLPEDDVPTGLPAERINELVLALTKYPERLPHSPQGEEAVRAARGDGRRTRSPSTTAWPSWWRTLRCWRRARRSA